MFKKLFGKNKTVIAVHNGDFHADDAFAVATLAIMLGGLDKIKISRTREGEKIKMADYVVDVGRQHDSEKNLFDHHQSGGAGARSNGIPFASFGLVWSKYGEKISGSKKIADLIDSRLTQPIDALDNGVSICSEKFTGVRPYDVSSIIGAMNSQWNENRDQDEPFFEAVVFAKKVIEREIELAQGGLMAEKFVIDAYNSSEDKRIIVLEKDFPWETVILKFPEPLYVIFPKENAWRIKAVRKAEVGFENRKDLPLSWAGKTGSALSEVTGVPGGIFCHNKLFVASAETLEAARSMAEIALKAPNLISP